MNNAVFVCDTPAPQHCIVSNLESSNSAPTWLTDALHVRSAHKTKNELEICLGLNIGVVCGGKGVLEVIGGYF